MLYKLPIRTRPNATACVENAHAALPMEVAAIQFLLPPAGGTGVPPRP
jgi:hypothetical protein